MRAGVKPMAKKFAIDGADIVGNGARVLFCI